MPLPLLLFDCDGTLVDSEPLLAEEMAAGLNSVGLPFATTDYLGEFRGARFRRIVAELQQRYGDVDPDQLERMEILMRANLATRLAQELTTIPGAREALDILSSYPSAVVSNGPESKILTALEATELSHYFGNRFFSGYTANCWKPEPCLHLHAASIMGYAARDCIAIDDALVGVRAALQAGMTVIHLNRFPDAEETPENAIMISNMYQLPAVVERLTREYWQTPVPQHSIGG
ncbi:MULTISPECIES: HAD family hydrolase [Halomonadaceae]|uniref:HAD family hydrolase n=1 Tax=Halomonadaceae TaxID=28256 RepID=UPI000C31BD49|nr:HAD-IA family hydrolase [Halomonas sp. MES3-P3E]PKG52984.1 haloacid dehalogenase [Halomonas sp. MES3-P3E]|tara:strand:+ start:446 stop:1144 length:699 start_codon:yes stop_codon:yes gene_type:complete